MILKGVRVKFRGKDVNGTYVYGDLLHSDCGVTFIHKETLPLDNRKRINPVTIAQLCGYDADGNEIYEGDKLFDEEHNTCVTAELYPGVHTQFYRKV